jgi:hypothetical protein
MIRWARNVEVGKEERKVGGRRRRRGAKRRNGRKSESVKESKQVISQTA